MNGDVQPPATREPIVRAGGRLDPRRRPLLLGAALAVLLAVVAGLALSSGPPQAGARAQRAAPPLRDPDSGLQVVVGAAPASSRAAALPPAPRPAPGQPDSEQEASAPVRRDPTPAETRTERAEDGRDFPQDPGPRWRADRDRSYSVAREERGDDETENEDEDDEAPQPPPPPPSWDR